MLVQAVSMPNGFSEYTIMHHRHCTNFVTMCTLQLGIILFCAAVHMALQTLRSIRHASWHGSIHHRPIIRFEIPVAFSGEAYGARPSLRVQLPSQLGVAVQGRVLAAAELHVQSGACTRALRIYHVQPAVAISGEIKSFRSDRGLIWYTLFCRRLSRI